MIKIEFKFTFYGGAQEVGRSSILMDVNKYAVMMDCGLKINPMQYPQLPDHVDSMILSHAHLDHSGMIPALYKKNGLSLYATDLTFEIAHILQRDSVKINRIKQESLIYSEGDIRKMQGAEIDVPYGKTQRLTDDISFELIDAGHIPGSSCVLLDVCGKKVLYTGDIKLTDTHLLKGANVPKADILITESTYGDRVHDNRKETEKDFIRTIEETLSRGGTALIPAFAVGRSQEILMMLKDFDEPVYLDGMSKAVTRLFLEYADYLKDPELFTEVAKKVNWVEHRGDRSRALSEPSIIVTTAGMLSGGPIMHYLGRLHKDSASSILLTGYQVEGTNGRLMMEEGYLIDPYKEKKLVVDMEKYRFDFSAHAGRHSLEKMVKKVNPDAAIVVHGDLSATESLGGWLSERCDAHVPKVGDSVTIDL